MRKFVKPGVFLLALVPFAFLLVRALTDNLGPDPAQELSIETGEWTLRFLLITLTLTPLRQLTGQSEFIRHRRFLFWLYLVLLRLRRWFGKWARIGNAYIARFISLPYSEWFIYCGYCVPM